ncbi:prolipoprotein diacylglyceryl transferase family protein [Ovoidimarina sediminis]|uniref:prolipoprotein diacylglyceryl transferase family protein n=1 Tax=Ovoidimarina sediminis TaxID=3079856 RepID=UPI00292F11AC|nr:prolipoprotein diacylglyceryl transferase family protein [Rhodophyticola sp. MJ-SS7]
MAGSGYAAALLIGALIGGYGFGTLNLALSNLPGIGRSILGALAGAIVAVELYKLVRGIRGSTGLIFIFAFATTVMVGRWGCFFAGLPDQTYGIATTMLWGADFGDGVLRHPVQLYESVSMGLFLLASLVLLAHRNPWFMANGFYLMTGFYAVQRFAWEFLKPYAAVIGPLNLFHLICLALVAYSTIIPGWRKENA